MQQAEAVKAAGYIRVSQERAVRNGYGLAAQEEDIRRFLVYKSWEPVETYREEGVSGYKTGRPAMDRLLADARAGRFDTVVFPSIDRAGRSVRDVIEIDQALQAAGVTTVFLREGVDTSTPTGQLFRNIMASVAEFEGKLIHERLLKGRRRKAAQGGYVGGWLPYGYRRGENREVEVAPEEAEVVRRVFTWSSEGRTLQWIADRLNERSIPSRNGGVWHASTIRGMLRNRFYTGRIEIEGEEIQARHEAIVSESVFWKCNS